MSKGFMNIFCAMCFLFSSFALADEAPVWDPSDEPAEESGDTSPEDSEDSSDSEAEEKGCAAATAGVSSVAILIALAIVGWRRE